MECGDKMIATQELMKRIGQAGSKVKNKRSTWIPQKFVMSIGTRRLLPGSEMHTKITFVQHLGEHMLYLGV